MATNPRAAENVVDEGVRCADVSAPRARTGDGRGTPKPTKTSEERSGVVIRKHVCGFEPLRVFGTFEHRGF